MAKYLIAWGNRADTATLSGGSWLASLPLANLQNRQVQRVARSTNAALASTKFVVDNGGTKTVQTIALVVHNMSAAAKIRISANDTNAFTSPIYTSGWLDVWPSGVIPLSSLEWEEDNFWLGTMTAEARAGYNAPFVHVLPYAQTLRYWQIEIDDTTNADGYVHLGRLFMAPAFMPAYNPEYGAELGYEDPTEVSTSLSGAEYFDVRGRYRVHSFRLAVMDSTEAHQQILELQRLQGISGEVLVVPNKDDASTFVQRTFVGRLKSVAPIVHDFFGNFSHRMDIKELL